MSEKTSRRVLALIVVLYLLLGTAYSVTNPIFESPDESLNYANIRFLIQERHLPVLTPEEATKAHHPPLYYVLGALLTWWVPNENFDIIVDRVNPFWIHEVSETGVDNKNLYLHDPALEGFPYQDVALGVHVVRWFSMVMGAGTVLCVYWVARELFPRQPALAAASAALVAFNPMFLYISTSVHDDVLANLVAAGTLYIAARLLVRGPTMRQAVYLGILTGLALLTKLTCLLILPAVGLGLLRRSLVGGERADRGGVFRVGGTIVVVALLIGGWWLVRNQVLYGEPTSMERQIEAWGGTREDAPNLSAATRELGFLYDSFWGVFGYGQIPMPAWAYGFPRLLGLLALGGLFLLWIQRRSEGAAHSAPQVRHLSAGGFLMLISAPVVAFVVVFIRMTLIDTANFGRYLFVSLGFLAPLYALGLVHLVGEDRAVWLPYGLAAAMLVFAVYALIGVLSPPYQAPRFLSLQEVRANMDPADLRFGEGIHLVGYDLSSRRTHPGGEISTTLCWEALESVEEDYVYFVHFLGPEEAIVGARSTHPGVGRYPTSRWTAGDCFCDTLDVPVGELTPAPAVYGVEIGWHKPGTDERLSAFSSDGSSLELVLLDRIKVAPEVYPAVAVPSRIVADLGAEITLLGYGADGLKVRPGDALSVTLYWAAQVPPPADYSVFLHLAASDGPPYAQDDGQPQRGRYPTSFWDVGEVVPDPRAIRIPVDLSPGKYPLVAGMYLLETGERLQWLGPDGRLRGDFVPLDTVVVQSEGL